MSPSPALPLEVERYIGACLITNQNRQKAKQQGVEPFYQQQQQRLYPNRQAEEAGYRTQRCGSLDGWAGGVPLISFVNRNRQNQARSQPYEDLSLARLAVHTQGAPLILAKTYNHRKNRQQRNQGQYRCPSGKPTKCDGPNSTADTVSVTSDESYGSTGSEQCLPRIIKPRKRRKKDRKNPPVFHADVSSPESTTSPFDFLDAETPRLHHSFDEVEDLDEDSKSTTRCQCRYCDPGMIWDADKTSYSSFLTPPERTDAFVYPDLSALTLEDDGVKGRRASASDLEVSTQIVTSLNGLRDLEIKFFSTANDKVYHQKGVDVETC
ncbi:uncharacterized protein LOC123671564 [Harmonia axyridis]|uniref:uncharacterized protein LOC123671564 n=1 Tax=Harmonia axyridis TaxID=115357 RepID=UPI001E275D3B|nr:uncharacterized protein LOC123671564 [Harmonia axyridis]